MRYAGQGHEIPVPLPARTLRNGDDTLLRNAFEAAYRTLYHRIIPSAAIEILSWTVRVSALHRWPHRVAVGKGDRRGVDWSTDDL